MPFQENCFTLFKESINSFTLPEQFTFPFYYQPHPLCLLAAKELQHYIETQQYWKHNFGLIENKETAIGKMFGVLLVENNKREIGYISAFSGKLADKNYHPRFVPPVFDMLAKNGFFLKGQTEINTINKQIEKQEKNPIISEYETILTIEKEKFAIKNSEQRLKMIEGRKLRKAQRTHAEATLNPDAFLQLKDKLSKESIKEKNNLRDLNIYWRRKIEKAEQNLNQIINPLTSLKAKRKQLSSALQDKLFKQYQFLNIKGKSKDLSAIFKNTSQPIPPAGSGECAAPKLLQYAFKNGMRPIAMAEFWWGQSPKSEIKKHRNFYGSCHGKCKPILVHMLEGIEMDDNPLLKNPAEGLSIDIIYEDEVMLVINKPSGLLSVPGKDIEDSVYSRIKLRYPNATGPLTVHRLDMSTSGLMLIALNKDAHKNLQKQFIKRTIKKCYIALLDGLLKHDKGTVELPLRVDLDDRPRQLVCYQHGKSAITHWKVIEKTNNKTKVIFHPITGRTHQLRVHSAHVNGLNTPIVGDDLYGDKGNRLHLHAEYIEFNHPTSNELMSKQVDPEF